MAETIIRRRNYRPFIVCTASGYTAISAKSWALAANLPSLYKPDTWKHAKAYAQYERVVVPGIDRSFEATTAGTSGNIAPSWNQTIDGTTTENTVTWTARASCGVIQAATASSILIQFWAKGLTSDRTADYQIVGWPSDTSYLANPIVGGTEPASVSPHGTLIADGVISFNVGTPVTIHPVTGATETWYPGHDITETVADFCELIHTATASDTYDQAAIIKIDDLLMFDDIGIQFDAISNSEATVMAVAHLSW